MSDKRPPALAPAELDAIRKIRRCPRCGACAPLLAGRFPAGACLACGVRWPWPRNMLRLWRPALALAGEGERVALPPERVEELRQVVAPELAPRQARVPRARPLPLAVAGPPPARRCPTCAAEMQSAACPHGAWRRWCPNGHEETTECPRCGLEPPPPPLAEVRRFPDGQKVKR